MKNKKILLMALCAAISVFSVFAAPMNPKKGYKDVEWGTTVKQAEKKGYALSLLPDNLAVNFKSLFTQKVDFYFVSSSDKDVSILIFCYYKDKFFFAIESLNSNVKNLKDFQNRYGKNIHAMGNGVYSDQTDGDFNVTVTVNAEGTTANVFDTVVTNAIISKSLSDDSASGTGSSGAASDPSGIVSEFSTLAQKLLQDPKKGNKATYAFLDFTTDNKNALVEKYITDALTEAVFSTGKVKIIERANLEKILDEQKFQASGLVDESQAANIGVIAGVEYVCYGTIKEIENGYTVNARVVDVETGEICAMSRTNVTKDSYLENAGSVAAKSSSSSYKASAPKKQVNSLWTCTSNRNDFDEYTTYTFVLKGPDKAFLFLGYDKFDNPINSRVKAGVSFSKYQNVWTGEDNTGNVDFKTETQGVISKKYDYAKWSTSTGWKDDNNSFCFCYNKNDSPRFFVELYENNSLLTVRHMDKVNRFQTAGFWDTVEANGITKEEIMEAISNEEF